MLITTLQAITSKRPMVTRDGVIIWVQVFASRIWGATLKGCIVGAGSARCWHRITAAWVIGGFAVIASRGNGWPCHLWFTRDFTDAGFTDGGAHVWGWRVAVLEWGVGGCYLGVLLLMSCSHCWGGLGGEA